MNNKFLLLIFLISCSPSIDPNSVKAKLDATTATQVDEIRIQRNTNFPISYLIVEPVRVSDKGNQKVIDVNFKGGVSNVSAQADLKVVSTEVQNYLLPRQRQISLQLISALTGVGDFNVIDYDAYTRTPAKYQSLADGKGPYFVRAVITESADAVVVEERKRKMPLIYRSEEFLSESIVGLDVSLVDIRNGHIAKSFPVRGTHIYKSAKSRTGMITDVSSNEVFMRSTVDQALRVALNNAAAKLHGILYEGTN
jgi:hypothetical protein